MHVVNYNLCRFSINAHCCYARGEIACNSSVELPLRRLIFCRASKCRSKRAYDYCMFLVLLLGNFSAQLESQQRAEDTCEQGLKAPTAGGIGLAGLLLLHGVSWC